MPIFYTTTCSLSQCLFKLRNVGGQTKKLCIRRVNKDKGKKIIYDKNHVCMEIPLFD